MALVECVPNFSEGRNLQTIDAIAAAIADTGVAVLDVSSDADHNRTVITFAGEPDVVVQGAFAGIQTAANLIDLREHKGVHPRLGAADVVPFVPLRDLSMDECVALAHTLGKRVGDELSLPVYLYEAAAQREERRNLADVRRGQFEHLQQHIDDDPALMPDYGPARVGPAGAVIIGARGPLIAFNAYLDMDDVNVARQIAKTVRASNGGIPYLKALGMLVNGRAQVSMNIIDFRQTSLFVIMEAVRAAAAQHGTVVTHTELVGLVPQRALIDTALAYLGLPPETRQYTLEGRVGQKLNDYREIVFE